MPGNGVGDRVHNFFAQDNLPQFLRSQDGNWPLNDNLWAGNQKQFGVSDPSPRNYNSQQATERGHGSQHDPDPHSFNITQTNARPDFARGMSHSHHEQPSSNQYMYGHQNFQTRPDEANFMGVDTEYGHNHVNQRGLLFSESQQEPASDQTSKNLFISESSEAHGSFDLFGGQHQANSQYPGLPQQPLQQQQQQSGFGDLQHLQQQLMLRKMQELQRQQQSQRRQELQRQEDIQQQNSLNQGSHFARQHASGSHSHGLVNGTQTSDSSGYGWTEPAAANPNWLHHASPTVQPDRGQPQQSMGFVNQQVEPSLYGVPVSNSRGPLNQFPHTNAFPGNSYAVTPEQHVFREKGLFGNTFSQGSNSGMKLDHIQQVNTPQNTHVQESHAVQAQDNSETEDAASLDPDEEKILFGSDDNIWDAFGSSKNMTGGVSSLLDDNEFASGVPSSLQSGSWSALMQSAVAETTSGDGGSGGVGVHEEWQDLNLQNQKLSHGKYPYEDSRKHQTQTALSDKNHSSMGFQHHAKNNTYEQLNQSSSGGSNWLNRGASPNFMPGQQTPQQHGTSQPNNKLNHWNANESVPLSENMGFNINENENLLQQSQNNDWKRVTLSNKPAAIPSLSNLQQGGNHSNQFSPNNHHRSYWKNADSSTKSRGSENSEISQRHLNNKAPQVSESSFNSSDKEDLNNSRRENSNDSYRSSSSHVPMSVGQREQFSSDVGDSRSLAGTQKNLFNQAGQKILAPRKFQYHPMGNLDEDAEVPYGTRQGFKSKPSSLQHSRGLSGQDQGNFGCSKTSGQGYVAEVEGVIKGSDDMRSKGMIPGHMPNIFTPHDRSVALSISDKAPKPIQNMLELLHKVDQSRDGIPRHLNSLERNLSSKIPEPENSDGSFGGSHQRSHSSNSQGTGLQLGPPSQRLPMAIQTTVKHNSLSQPQPSVNLRGKPHVESQSDRMGIEISSQSESQSAGHNINNLSAALGTNHRNSRNQLQDKSTAGNESFNGHTQIRQADEPHGRSLSSALYDNSASSEKLPVSQSLTGENLPASHHRGNLGVSQQGSFPNMLPNAISNLQRQQLFSSNEAHKGQLNIVESAIIGQQQLMEREAEKKRNSLSNLGVKSLSSQGIISSIREKSTEKVDGGQMLNGPAPGNDSINMPPSDASEIDVEAFGRSLKPNNFNQQISLMNQMKAFKNTDYEPSNRVLKRLRDSENLLPGQQVTVPPGYSELRRSTGPTDNVERSLASLPANPSVKDVLTSDQNGSQSGISVKTEQTHISPQMAPSWFDQYGTFKSGQISQRADVIRTKEQHSYNVGNDSSILETPHSSKEPASVTVDTSQSGVIWKTPAPMPVDQLNSTPLQTNTSVQTLVALRPKKRKWSRDEINSWLKEVSGSSKNLQGICGSSMEWCKSTNRLMEKVDGDGEVTVDFPRPKRRIIVATQLIQQLFPPPPATLLSADTTSSYESVAFYVSRLALGDTCNLVSGVSNSEFNLLTDENRESERVDDYRPSKAVEDCISSEKRLESDFSRVDKKASILDLRVECQELEKFSSINRFAKFHGRGQPEGEASSSDAATNIPKPTPQRYVIALPLPKNLPERVQCLSL